MFAHIRGKIIQKNFDNKTLVIEANAIGYLLECNLKTLNALQVNQEETLYTKLLSNDDGMRLLGFLSDGEKQVFEQLISVSGVGPKAAQNILEMLRVEEIAGAILNEDAKLISKAHGVGKKTAERIILELANKFSNIDRFVALDENKSYSSRQEVTTILEGLGFDLIEIGEKLEQAQQEGLADDAELLVKYCISQ